MKRWKVHKTMIFISHSSKDDALTTYICEVFEQNNMKCWVDHREKNLYYGSDWAGEITRAIKQSDLMVLVFTKNSNISTQCPKEIAIADSCRIPILNLYLDNISMNDSFEYHLSLFNHLYCLDGIENHINSIVDGAEKLIDEKKKGNDFIAYANKENLRRYSKNFAIKKQSNEKLFNEEAIDNGLIPQFRDSCMKYTIDDMFSVVEQNNIVVTAPEGGAGKTTFILKLFHHYMNNGIMIPIYIDMKMLTAENWLIERYIDMALAEKETAMDMKNTDQFIQDLCDEFSRETEKPEYLILLDGFNEVTTNNKQTVVAQLKKWTKRSNTRIVISSRKFDKDIIQNTNLLHFEMEKLSKSTIDSYLTKNDILDINGHKNKNLIDILSIPMFLDIYINSGGGRNIKTKGDLLLNFMSWQEKKEQLAQSNTTINRFCLNYILPAIAFYMTTNDESNSYYITKKDCHNVINDIFSSNSKLLHDNDLFSNCYRQDYKKNNYNTKEIRSFFKTDDEWEVCERNDDIVDFFLNTCGLMRQNVHNDLEFIHQNYRDFLCAYFISREMQMAEIHDDFVPHTLSKVILENDVIVFISDLLGEHNLVPVCNNDKRLWDYECNSQSISYNCLNYFRNNDDSIAVGNIVNILKYARKTDLSNCDFSNLDLTKCYFNNCVLYRFYDEKNFSSTFEGSKINKENIIAEAYSGSLTDACLYNDVLATCDNTSHIRLWDIQSKHHIPFKSFKAELYPIKKILFMSSKSIIAMTDYDIAKINIESKETSILHTSESLLNEIFVEENGDISFTTVTNPLNKKIIGNIQFDAIKFSPFTTISAINKQQKLIAFKNVCNDGRLSLYSPNDGYILAGQYLALYKILKPYAGYIPIKIPMRCFRTAVGSDAKNDSIIISKIERLISYISKHSNISVKIQHNSNNITFIIADNSKKESIFEDCPELVLSKLAYDELKSTIPSDYLEEFFNELKLIISNEKIHRNSYKWMVNKFLDKLKNSDFDILDTLNLRFHSIYGKIFGNKVEDLIVKNIFDDSKTNNIHPNSIKFVDDYKLLLSEDDTILIYDIKNDQLETVFSINSGKFHYVDYMNGRIVAIYGNTVCVLDNEYNVIFHASQSITQKSRLAKLFENIFVSCGCILYEFDSNLTCKRSIKTPFGFAEPVIAQSWRDTKYYVINTKKPIAVNSGDVGCENTNINDYYNPTDVDYRILDKISFKRNQNIIVSIDTKINRVIAQNVIQNGLVLVGCNFKNIRGTLSDNENLEILECYGAVV
ncbi:MAG: TIR domain-containing protein [Eubacterium sp.]|nr:TIR domain-containing protein [Eubacterium sp.]